MNNENVKVIYNNKRANFDFDLLERFEAGLSLTGTEIKSIRAHHISLQRSFVQAKDNELWLMEANISPYEHGNRENHEPTRPRKLLLHRREINRILTDLAQKGLTVADAPLPERGAGQGRGGAGAGKRKFDKRPTSPARTLIARWSEALREKYGRCVTPAVTRRSSHSLLTVAEDGVAATTRTTRARRSGLSLATRGVLTAGRPGRRPAGRQRLAASHSNRPTGVGSSPFWANRNPPVFPAAPRSGVA
jgi:SsrA-binding protein